MKNRIWVQFDGSNFYNKIKGISRDIHLTTFDYSQFAKFISKKTPEKTTYYVGEIKKYPDNKKSEILYSGQQSLFLALRKQGVEVKLGYLLFSNGKFHEKGVDVQIAVDMVRGAIKKEYDTCYLISSDTDLLPAIEISRLEGKKIIYVAFDKFVSKALSKNSTSVCILKNKDILTFSKPNKKERIKK